MSANLGVLARSGLVRSRREGRSIRYFADMEGVRGLLSFLMEDAAAGVPNFVSTFSKKSPAAKDPPAASGTVRR